MTPQFDSFLNKLITVANALTPFHTGLWGMIPAMDGQMTPHKATACFIDNPIHILAADFFHAAIHFQGAKP